MATHSKIMRQKLSVLLFRSTIYLDLLLKKTYGAPNLNIEIRIASFQMIIYASMIMHMLLLLIGRYSSR